MSAFAMPELKPLEMGQLIDRATRLYRQNFLKFIGIISITQLPSSVFAVLLTVFSAQSERLVNLDDPFAPGSLIASVLSGAFLTSIVAFVLSQIGTAALTRAIADQYLGHPVSIGDSYRKLGRAWLSLLGGTFLAGIVMVAIMAALFILVLIPCIGAVFAFLFAIPGSGMLLFWGSLVLPLIAPVVVIERQRARYALHRAWDLARRRFWWAFGFAVLLTMFSYLIVVGPTFLIVFGLQSMVGSGLNEVISAVIQQLATFILSVLYYPLQLTCITLLYFDIRIRTEGFDLEVLAASADGSDVTMEIAQKAPEPMLPFNFNMTEIGYFSLIAIGAGLLLGGIFLLLVGLGAAFGATLG